MATETGIEILKGKTLRSVKQQHSHGADLIVFWDDDGEEYHMFHSPDCCENVSIDDIAGDLDDLVGAPILMAEESSNRTDPPKSKGDDSYTWTFYRLATVKGYVTIRWYGESNGYYSEEVSFKKVS